jgi:hypothetical protein
MNTRAQTYERLIATALHHLSVPANDTPDLAEQHLADNENLSTQHDSSHGEEQHVADKGNLSTRHDSSNGKSDHQIVHGSRQMRGGLVFVDKSIRK